MMCELNETDWYFSVGSAMFTLGAMIAFGVAYLKEDVSEKVCAHEKRLNSLDEKVDHNHKHYEREVLLLLKEALNQSPRSIAGSMCDNNSIPGGE